ncbi:MAG: nicotinate (nicotinamide) nucleotide adenylyltransferase [Gemmatimonadales bacterium]|nr:nicotinate (nicotinamide) nucleotide adenylyltransferase [Gemmatimonadales bacterium]
MIRAVFGGTFDPVHSGHRLIVQAILAEGLADFIHVVPAWLSPHKTGFSASPEHRLNMVQLVFRAGDDRVVETLEMDRASPGFTVETLSELRARYREDRFRLVVGADNLAAFGDWHAPERILEQADLIILARQSGDLSEMCKQAGIASASCHLLGDFDERVSATEIRARFAAGEESGSGLDPAVLAYIHDHGLYRG